MADKTYLEDKVDKMAEDLAFLRGQMEAIPPADLVRLAQRVAHSEGRMLGISAFMSALVAGLVSFFFKGGNA